ncbi:MAG: ATP synthase F1 subunit delta [Planctomycetia bacterium]
MSRSNASHSEAAHVDIAADRVAKVYAQAILEAGDAATCTDAVLGELAMLARDVLPKVPEAGAAFASPKVPADQKAALIDKLGKGRLTPTTVNALHVLAQHGRLGILSLVVAAAERLADERAGRQQAIFTTAIALGADEQARIVADVEKALSARLKPAFVVDPAIIGGLVVRVGDTIYDQSVVTSLTRLGGRLHQRNIQAIQTGEYSWHS